MQDEVDPNEIALGWLGRFAAALASGGSADVEALFEPECYWRDFVAFTWNVATFEGRASIAAMVVATTSQTATSGFTLDRAATAAGGVVEAWFRFETALGRGIGQIRLVKGLARTLFTALRELKGFEEKQGPTREAGTVHGAFRNRRTWADGRAEPSRESSRRTSSGRAPATASR